MKGQGLSRVKTELRKYSAVKQSKASFNRGPYPFFSKHSKQRNPIDYISITINLMIQVWQLGQLPRANGLTKVSKNDLINSWKKYVMLF